MGSGIIIDDGGSTRIKWFDSKSTEVPHGRLEDLMDVKEEGNTGKSTHKISKDALHEHVQITYLDGFGRPDHIARSLSINDKVHVRSHLKQNVLVERLDKGLNLSLFGDEVGPIVEARQHEQKRRYIVTNSGPIETVSLESKGTSTVIYDANTVLRPEQEKPVIYTSVVIYADDDRAL